MLALLCLVTGCSRLKQKVAEQVDNDPRIRAQAIASARTACIDTGKSKAPQDTATQARISSYCDCFATRGMGSFSNSELVSLGLSGGRLSPDQQKKVMQGVILCRSNLVPAHVPGGTPTAR